MNASTPRIVRPASGWILLETIVALMMLSIGGVAVNRAMQEALVTRAMARDFTEARFLMEQVMSELELQPALVEGESKSGNFGDDFPRFSYQWNVSRVELPQPELPPQAAAILVQPLQLPVHYLGKIHVTLTWTRAGRKFSRSAETLIAPERIFTEEDAQAGQPQQAQ